ncbi:hypothetical protein L1887_09028 [Cichorium endivia]|nr:hypothetical protein L1887_09028 [Cichorium endivia]
MIYKIVMEKESEMTTTNGTIADSPTKNPKKINLLDHHSIKHLLDESVSEIVTSRGYSEDVRMSNVRLLIIYTKEKNAIMFTYPPSGSVYNSTGLMISSKLPRYSDMYTLTIASADPKSISANPTVEFTKSVHKGWGVGGRSVSSYKFQPPIYEYFYITPYLSRFASLPVIINNLSNNIFQLDL